MEKDEDKFKNLRELLNLIYIANGNKINEELISLSQKVDKLILKEMKKTDKFLLKGEVYKMSKDLTEEEKKEKIEEYKNNIDQKKEELQEGYKKLERLAGRFCDHYFETNSDGSGYGWAEAFSPILKEIDDCKVKIENFERYIEMIKDDRF